MLRETKEQTLSVRVTRLADWLLRIRARYEPMNGFTESAGLLHELLAKTESLKAEIEALKEENMDRKPYAYAYCPQNSHKWQLDFDKPEGYWKVVPLYTNPEPKECE